MRAIEGEAFCEEKKRFLTNMSHEIRTPLGIILGFSELLFEDKVSLEDRGATISAIRRNGELLSKIIDEILEISKFDAGRVNFEIGTVSVSQLMGEVKEALSLSAKEKNIELNFNVVGKIPSSIQSNSSRLQQILINVIGNAIKFSPAGTVNVSVSFERAQGNQPHFLKVNVKDSGPGLSNEQVQNLFQPFTQVDNSMTRKFGGAGLGLALSKKIAHGLGGDLYVQESRLGQGCNFALKINAGFGHDLRFVDFLETQKPVHKKVDGSQELPGVRVLLVEDFLDNQVLVSRFLSMEGAKVDVANNGLEGVEKAMKGEYDIVLMDIQMPELDGFGAFKKLRQLGFEKPIVALTAHGMIEDREKCLQIGFSEHLTKPVKRLTLIKQVKQFSNVQTFEEVKQ
jgi:CheY-like chemotaxis protein